MTNQEAIKRIKEHIAIHKYRESHAIHIVEALDMAISALEKQIQIGELPSAQTETGYWISARDEDGRHMWLICSECRAEETNLKAKYCPVCGRKMA